MTATHPQSPAPQADARPCAEQCWACAESGIGCNLVNDAAPQAEAAEPVASFYVRFAKEWITVDEDERQAISRFVAGWYDDDAVPPPPPPQRQEAAQVEAPLISHRETVSKPGACLKVDVLHLTDAGRACLTSSLKSLPGLASRVAALTMQAVKVPLTEAQILAGWGHGAILANTSGPPHRGLKRELETFTAGVRFTEQAHGIQLSEGERSHD